MALITKDPLDSLACISFYCFADDLQIRRHPEEPTVRNAADQYFQKRLNAQEQEVVTAFRKGIAAPWKSWCDEQLTLSPYKSTRELLAGIENEAFGLTTENLMEPYPANSRWACFLAETTPEDDPTYELAALKVEEFRAD